MLTSLAPTLCLAAGSLFSERLAFTEDWAGETPAIVIADRMADEGRGEVWIVSTSGEPLARIEGPDDGLGFGSTLATGRDLDGDGIGDVAIGVPSTMDGKRGRLCVVSGRTGEIGLSFDVPSSSGGTAHSYGGPWVAAVDDIDGDGVADLCVGVPLAAGAEGFFRGLVRTCSGKTGVTLHEVTGGKDEALGRQIVAIGDVDGNGTRDVAIGVTHPEQVRVLLLPGLETHRVLELDGGLLELAPDRERLLVGAPDRRRVHVVSPATGETLHTLEGEAETWGTSVVTLTYPAGPCLAVTTTGRLLQGRGGIEWWTLDSTDPVASWVDHESGFGVSAVSVGDLDGDGADELAVGTATPRGQGLPQYVSILSTRDGGVLVRTIRRKDLVAAWKSDR